MEFWRQLNISHLEAFTLQQTLARFVTKGYLYILHTNLTSRVDGLQSCFESVRNAYPSTRLQDSPSILAAFPTTKRAAALPTLGESLRRRHLYLDAQERANSLHPLRQCSQPSLLSHRSSLPARALTLAMAFRSPEYTRPSGLLNRVRSS